MPITRGDILAHLERAVRVGFLAGVKEYTPRRSAFTAETTSDGAFEIYANLGSAPWPIQIGGQTSSGTDGRTGGPSKGGPTAGGPITVLGTEERSNVVWNDDWSVSVAVTHNAINDDRIGELATWAQNSGSRFQQHMDYLCFSALNSGEGTTYGKCYDGLSFFNDSHIDPGAEYQTAQDNKYASALSLDNFETVRIAAAKFKDSRGQPYGGLGHTLLIHAVDLERTAAQITDNVEDYGTGNRARNPYAGQITRLGVPGSWFDSTAWVLVDPQVKPIILQVRQMPMLETWDDFSQGSGIRYFKWFARYTVSYGDWRGCIMGNT